jgi:hypothetical protein
MVKKGKITKIFVHGEGVKELRNLSKEPRSITGTITYGKKISTKYARYLRKIQTMNSFSFDISFEPITVVTILKPNYLSKDGTVKKAWEVYDENTGEVIAWVAPKYDLP